MIAQTTIQTPAAWDAIATGYDDLVTPTHFWLGEEALRRAGVAAGMYVLDVAAGSGALSIPAARLGARVLSVDHSPSMLARLDARAREEGLDIETRVMDGHALALDEGTFDAAGSQFGVMLFPDMPRGIREMARVTRRGGRVLMVVFGDPRQVEFIQFFIRAIQAVRPDFAGLPMDPPPLPFQLRDPARLRQELADAGLSDVRVDTIVERLEVKSSSQLWGWLMNSNPIAGALLRDLQLDEDATARVRQALDDLVRARAAGGSVAILTNPIHIGIGTK